MTLPTAQSRMTLALDETRRRVADATRRHGPIVDAHQAYGLMCEEVAEFFDEVRRADVDHARIRDEALDVATVALRAALWASHRLMATGAAGDGVGEHSGDERP